MSDPNRQHQQRGECKNGQTFRVWGPGVYSFTVKAACLEANPHGGYEIRGVGGEVLVGITPAGVVVVNESRMQPAEC